MKNSQLTFALMAGLPGAGKSTLAYALSRVLNWHVIDKDRHKEILLKQGWDDETAGIVTYELAFETARNVLEKQQASVILDSAALHTFILDKALNILEYVPNVRLKVILCVADHDLRHKRLRSRPLQITNIRVNPETIADYLRLFQHLPPHTLTLYTINPMYEYLEDAKKYLLS